MVSIAAIVKFPFAENKSFPLSRPKIEMIFDYFIISDTYLSHMASFPLGISTVWLNKRFPVITLSLGSFPVITHV